MQEKITISKKSSEKIQELLKDFVNRIKVNGVFIITKSGQLIEEYGYLRDLNTLSLSAILSGIADSIENLGRLVKENINDITIEGKEWKVYFKIFKEDYILSCIYKGINIGMVKFESISLIKNLEDTLEYSKEEIKKDDVNDMIDKIIKII